ncbi:MAG: hypothetical protein JNK89_11270 [Saprospiraceae bacterium]|nr:hypothetical protein [Saprospiraceae bacterium]
MYKFLFPIVFSLAPWPAQAQNIKDSLQAKGIQWRMYREAGFQIGYPANWTRDLSGMMGASFILFAPQDSDTDAFKENVNLQVTDLGVQNVITLDVFAKAAEDQIEKMITASEIRRSAKVNTGNPQTEYYEIEFTGLQGKLNLHWIQHYRIKGRYAYILTFTAQSNKYDDYQALARSILKSFQLM